MGADDEVLYLLAPTGTQEAFCFGEGPKESGPVFFTSRAVLEEFAREQGIADYGVHEVPAGVLSRMKGKPYWVDGKPPAPAPRPSRPLPPPSGGRRARQKPPT